MSDAVMARWTQGGKRSHDPKRGKLGSFIPNHGGSNPTGFPKSLGLTLMSLTKATIARFFRVHEEGLHLKIVKNGKCENVWPQSNGKFLVPTRRVQKLHM